MRTKIRLQFPSNPPTELTMQTKLSQEQLATPMTLDDSKQKLSSEDPTLIAQGAWGIRCIVLRGTDITSSITLITSKLRWALNSENETQTKVYLSESLMFAAKNRIDISESFSLVPIAIEDTEMQVRNYLLLALGYSSLRGADISIFLELIVRRLDDEQNINKEAAVWTLKEHASKSKSNAHNVLMLLPSEKNDNVYTSDVREACLETLKG